MSNNDIAHAYGGSFGRQSCIANYWREVEKLTAEPASPNLDLSWLQNNDRKLYEASPPDVLEIENGRAPDSLNLKATIYVDGDVYITDDIINNDANTPKWYNPSQIGYLSIIVRGDINIAPGVKRIDALLVAYPKEDSAGNIVAGTGTIRTCSASYINTGNHFQECDKQLVINGALVAEKVLFGRVHASVKQEMVPILIPAVAGAYERVVGGYGGCPLAESTYGGVWRNPPMTYYTDHLGNTFPEENDDWEWVWQGSPTYSMWSSPWMSIGNLFQTERRASSTHYVFWRW